MAQKPGLRRVVAGIDATGKSRVLQDGPAPHHVVHGASGVSLTDIWSTDTLAHDFTTADPTLVKHQFFPGPAGTRFSVTTMPSLREIREAAAAADMAQADAGFAAALPGMTDTYDDDGSGMHRTHTIDYGIVLSGAVGLELDDGVILRLNAGDSYVLKSARHKWHPQEDTGCVFATVLIGVPAGEPG